MHDKSEPSFLKGMTPEKGEPNDPEALTIAEMNGSTALRPANKLLTRLHVVLKSGVVRSFQYMHLDSGSKFDGNEFTFVFIGAKHLQVEVKGHGPKLWAIYDYCCLHRWPYLREALGNAGKFAADGETVITEIKITDITPPPGA
jgi:hypothetical protein